MKERKLGLAKRLSAFALAFVMVFSLLATFNVSALAADDNEPTLNPGWTYDGEAQDLILAPGESDDEDYAMYYYATTDEDYEPLAPTKTRMGDWTRNWRDDDMLTATNAGEYYVWYCTFSEDENDVDVEPTLAGVVEVEKATIDAVEPEGNSRTVSHERLTKTVAPSRVAGVSLLKDNTGIIKQDDATFAKYRWAVTGTDTTEVTEADLYEGDAQMITAYKDEAGKYRLWYQAYVSDAEYEDNYEDGDIKYVDVTITEGKETMVVDPKRATQTEVYANATGPKGLLDPNSQTNPSYIYDSVDGTMITPTSVYYGSTKATIDSTTVPASTVTDCNQTQTIWYKVTAPGYNDLTGTITYSLTKDKAKVDNVTLPNASATTQATVTVTGTVRGEHYAQADKAAFKAMASTSTSKPSTSRSEWKSIKNNSIDLTDQLKANKINYIYYMAKSTDTKNMTDSDISYAAYYVTGNSTDGWVLSQVDITGTTYGTAHSWVAPQLANPNALSYTGAKQSLLKDVGSTTNATIQFNVKYTDNLKATTRGTAPNSAMPAASDGGWTTASNITADKVCASAVGTYEVWWRVTITEGSTTYQSTPAKLGTVTINPKSVYETTAATPTGFVSGIEAPVVADSLYWTGKNQALFTAGKVEKSTNPDLSWMYMTTHVVDGEDVLVGFGTTPVKASDADNYKTTAILVDSNYNYSGGQFSALFASATRLINNYGFKGQVVGALADFSQANMADYRLSTTIEKGQAEVTAPTLTKAELTYDGEDQSLLATSGKTSLGTLYQVVTDSETGRLVSLDGTAEDAGSYVVGYLVTDLDPFSLTIGDALIGWNAASAQFAQVANVWDEGIIGSKEIEKATPEVTGVVATSNEITGYDIELCTYGETDGGKIYYKATDENKKVIFDADGWRIVPEASEMGEYAIQYKVVGDKNHENLDWVTLKDKAQIAAGKAEVTTEPVGLGYNADGTAKPLVTAGEAENGVMVYALGTALEPVTDWSADIPTATEEGEYYVWYKAKGDESFADSDKDFVVATIGHETVLYRIFNPASGEHIYTYDEAEVANATQNLGWTLDGTVSGTSEGSIPVYRLENLVNPGVHIYSTDENEIATLVDAGVAKLEGVQFMTVPQGEGTENYYRLSSPSFPHHYTADQNEINSLIASGVYTLDGYAWSFPGTSN